uniref:RNA methyltransferase n=1 Tax=Arundo donax TaxID=35708 RepID=A0A0A9FYA6_ARUDO
MKFECRSILGVDIDSGLIETAKWNLRRISRLDKGATKNSKAQESSNSPSQSSMEEVASEMSNGNSYNHKHKDLFKTVSFRRENFVESLQGCSERYDTIMCLSVTKWIHLNWGDDGLIALFVMVWRLLREGFLSWSLNLGLHTRETD